VSHEPADQYADPRIQCTDEAVVIKGYYFPWGSKRVPYASIKGVRRVELAAARGRARIWGTANPGYWANYDPQRPRKKVALLLQLGRRVQPFITPEDPDGAEAVIRRRAGLPDEPPSGAKGPLI
jgi:hypothetical protein